MSPFKSKKQRSYLWATHPDIAQSWTDTYGSEIVPGEKKRKRKQSKKSRKRRGRRKDKK